MLQKCDSNSYVLKFLPNFRYRSCLLFFNLVLNPDDMPEHPGGRHYDLDQAGGIEFGIHDGERLAVITDPAHPDQQVVPRLPPVPQSVVVSGGAISPELVAEPMHPVQIVGDVGAVA